MSDTESDGGSFYDDSPYMTRPFWTRLWKYLDEVVRPLNLGALMFSTSAEGGLLAGGLLKCEFCTMHMSPENRRTFRVKLYEFYRANRDICRHRDNDQTVILSEKPDA